MAEKDATKYAKIAALALQGGTSGTIGKALGISDRTVREYMKDAEYQETFRALSVAASTVDLEKFRGRLARFQEKVLKVLEQHLDDGNLEAVKIWLKAAGVDTGDKQASDTHMTVILPGATAPKDINIEVTSADPVQDQS